jgi:hypothetical protein
MKKADILSRRIDHKRGVENDNKNTMLLKPEYFRVRAMEQGHLLIDGMEKEILSQIRKCEDQDEEVIKAVKQMRGKKKKTIKGDEWAEEQDLILFQGKVYVPRTWNSKEKLPDYIMIYQLLGILGNGEHWN